MVIVVGSIAMCIIFSVSRLPIRPCDERPHAMYGNFAWFRGYPFMTGTTVHLIYTATIYSAARRESLSSAREGNRGGGGGARAAKKSLYLFAT